MSSRSGGGRSSRARANNAKNANTGNKSARPNGTLRAPSAARPARPAAPQRPTNNGVAGRLVPAQGHPEKLTFTRAEREAFKELKANRGTYERNARIYDYLEQRAQRSGNEQDRKFYSLMRSAMRSQINVFNTLEERRVLLRAQQKAAREAKKAALAAAGLLPPPRARGSGTRGGQGRRRRKQ